MQKIILYYIFTPLADPEAIRLWQKTLAQNLNLKGRILLSPHGINGTLGGQIDDVKAYVKITRQYAPFKNITFKWSDGTGQEFPRLSVKVRPEIVAFDAADELEVTERGVRGGGVHLKPEELHKLVAERGDDVIFFDGRNAYEAQVGKFKNAVVPAARTSRDFKKELEGPKYDSIKNKPVVTYCTGGIRCEVLSAMMKSRGFTEVYQLDGGIVKYGEKFKDDGLWEGKLYVFDGRLVHQFSDKAKDIGHCIRCDAKTSNFENCQNMACNNLVLLCEGCSMRSVTCSADCLLLAGAAKA